jgi:hypothetical protein
MFNWRQKGQAKRLWLASPVGHGPALYGKIKAIAAKKRVFWLDSPKNPARV